MQQIERSEKASKDTQDYIDDKVAQFADKLIAESIGDISRPGDSRSTSANECGKWASELGYLMQ